MRRKEPVTPAELLGVQLRQRCGKCILWILSVFALGYTGGAVLDGIKSLEAKVEARNLALTSN